ncbi:uncharacterized protein LOC128253352 isoform X2 [Drosophila gunungcola]|uniref:uncharacterized protein LOC128253352 isoform X2 n=1 Tax=Drosophila gunungcola TaxID=103775 RepID=UPI0022E2C855|nr:uncharacterized protein LOC128253352 isoform X2 [Drosophila gunungcola]
MGSIVNLDDKCLLKIIGYLDLEEQLDLWQATESISRLNKVVSSTWQSHKKYALHRKSFENRAELLHNFLQCISPTMVNLTLKDFPVDQLYALRSHSFPNARILDYSGVISNVNEDLESLVNCFPLIESFKITVDGEDPAFEIFAGHLVARWENLRRLDIIGASRHWNTKCFQEICNRLPLQFLAVAWRDSEEDDYVEAISKLQELDVLQLELDLLSRESTSMLLTLPKLRRLRFDEFEDVECLLEHVAELRGQDVVALTCNENFWLWLTPNRFQNVRKMSIINEGVVEGIWCEKSFYNNIIEFPRLMELYLEDITIWQTGDVFWEMISSCPQLQLLHLQNHEIEDRFLEFSASTMDKALCRRNEPLFIHFANTSHKDLIFKHFSHVKLEISFKVIKNAYPNLTGGLVELEFTPRNIL